jgi:hypothetical protein
VLLNNPNELDESIFRAHGIKCRACQSELLSGGDIKRISAEPRLPWSELIECITCVKPEDYFAQDGILDKPSFKPKHQREDLNIVHIADTHILVGSAVEYKSLRLEPSLQGGALFLDDAYDAFDSRRHAFCQECGSWIGEAEIFDAGVEYRLAKYCLEAEDAFALHSLSSCVSILLLEGVRVRECHRFVIGDWDANGSFSPRIRLVVLTQDTWMASHIQPTLKPIIKVSYWIVQEDGFSTALDWASRIQAERISLPNHQVCAAVVKLLESSTLSFPHSLRRQHDQSTIGFLYIF